ncbi:hypothetical protein BDQ12DRAFT_691224 [Crucibulum laeve]|uniref:Uncharacterized protein n=1 Tax=Crucibulum laeve TaxID=68775 RepID=A0A5C3LL42_9AGAR|nr:hypothetical protein BDQ12DRAFT_691224 [Crucibulum laeve]
MDLSARHFRRLSFQTGGRNYPCVWSRPRTCSTFQLWTICQRLRELQPAATTICQPIDVSSFSWVRMIICTGDS